MRGALVVALLVPSVAQADVRFGGAHGAYSIGGAAINGPGDGARSALDVGFNLGFFDVTGNRDGMWDTKNGYTVGASFITGFGASPTYGVLELGTAADTGIAGFILSVGPVVRVDPDPTAGVGVRIAADLLGVEAGIRAIAAGTDTELLDRVYDRNWTTMIPVRIAAASFLVVALADVAHAGGDFGLGGGHVAYSLGGALLNGPGDGARSAVDAGLAFGWMRGNGSFGARQGPSIGASVVSGFTTSPTYVAVEAGLVNGNDLAGVSLSVGPALQLDPDSRLGVTLRASADMLLLQFGLRLTVMGADDPEVSLAVSLGFGEF